MRQWIVLSMGVMLTGCAKVHHTKVVQIAPEALPYVQRFVDESIRQGRPVLIDDLVVRFTHKYDGTVTAGNCHFGDENVTPVVSLNIQDWAYFTDAGHEQVTIHELGHCLLGRGHVEGYVIDLNQTIDRSIMSPIEFSDGNYLNHHAYYMYELFHGS